jgi:hypothetical protein
MNQIQQDVDGIDITRPVREPGSPSSPVRKGTIEEWLKQHGFEAAGGPAGFVIGSMTVCSTTLTKQSVEIALISCEEELIELLLQFDLASHVSPPLASWQELVDQLCREWNLLLFDPVSQKKVGSNHLFHLLTQLPQWQLFGLPVAHLS